MRGSKRILKIALMGMSVCLLAGAVPLSHCVADTNPPMVSITWLDASRFPLISLHLAVRDAEGIPLKNLAKDMIQVIEDTSIVPFNMETNTFGAHIVYIADAGMGISAPGATGQTRWTEMTDALSDLFSSDWMLTGKDAASLSVQVPGMDAPIAVMGTTNDASQLISALHRYSPQLESNQYSDGLKAIQAALEYFAAFPNESGQFRCIVFFSQGLQTGSQEDLAQMITDIRYTGIPIFAVLFRSEELPAYAQPLQTIATQSGGKYFFYTDRNISQSLSSLLADGRSQYVITYSSSAKESGNKVIRIGLNMPGARNAGATKYSIRIAPPIVSILSPKDGEAISLATMTPQASPEGTIRGSPDASTATQHLAGYRIDMSIAWPDGHPRKVKTRELLINGQPVMQENDPPADTIILKPNSLPMILGNYGQLQLRITDELGWTAESKPVNVIFASGNTSNSSQCEGVAGDLQNMACHGTSAIPSIGSFIPWAGFLCALAALALALRFRQPISGVTRTAASQASNFIEEVGHTVRFQGRPRKAKAYLMDEERTGDLSQNMIELYGTTSIGRLRAHADRVVQTHIENSPVSRLHCTLLEEDGVFYVRDQQSANGTFVNGIQLVPLERHLLADGDEIELAKLAHGGVKLRFQLTLPFRSPPRHDITSAGALTNRLPRDRE